jgi:formylglycine-generating enzyme required for sulfatase activity
MAKNWAIIIGINNYSYLEHLKFAKTDAEAMHYWLQQEGGFDRQGLFLFTDDSKPIEADPPIPTEPTFGHLDTFFDVQFEQQLLTNVDNLWFFFSGHGNRGSGGDYLMLSDSNPRRLEQTALSVSYITERLRNWGAGNVVMFIDACRNVENQAKGGTIITQDYQGMIAFYSCRAREKSLEVKSIERGAFTHVLLQALGETKKQNRCLTVAELEKYLMTEVPKLSPNQHPLARVEPTYKSEFILFGEAQKDNIELLKNLAYKKVFEDKKEEAREVLIHANIAAKGSDLEIINSLVKLSSSSRVIEPNQSKSENIKSLADGEIELKRKDERITIFIDGDNLSGTVLRSSTELDYQRLLSIFQAKSSTCQAFFYLTVTNVTPPHLLPKLEKYGYQIRQAKGNNFKSNIDSLLISDLIGLSESYDTAVLVSGDSDFCEPIKQIQSRGKSVELISFLSSTSRELIEIADIYLDLESESIELLDLPTYKFETVTFDHRGEIIKRKTKTARYYAEDLGKDITLDMVAVPGGKFRMGTEDSEIERLCKKYNVDYFRRERPQHEVTVPPFFMGKYPITQAQWRAIASRPDLKVERDLNPNPANFKDLEESDLCPVERVSWYDAVEFCKRLSKLSKLGTEREYRLPSEAEWEYACRAGTTTLFSFGETITGKLANYNASYTYAEEAKGENRQQTTPVGQFLPNGFGLYDMHGNVWEWCLDIWHDNYEDAPTDGSAWLGGGYDDYRIMRGGSWDTYPNFCRSAYRDFNRRDNTDVSFGFRVACVAGRTL